MHTKTQLPETGFIRLPTVLAVFPVSRSAFLAGVKSGKYPAPVKLSSRTVAWKVDSIRSLITSFDQTAAVETGQLDQDTDLKTKTKTKTKIRSKKLDAIFAAAARARAQK